MSFYCDWCGELIEGRDGLVTLQVSGNHTDGGYIRDARRHFHAGSSVDDDSCILRALAPVDEHRPKGDQERERDERSTRSIMRGEAEGLWKGMPQERREALLLQALADDRLVVRELTERMNAELYVRGDEPYPIRALRGSEVASLVKRLWRQGQLEREAETFNVNHTRYRYFRRRGLEGPIVDLEQAFRDMPATDGEVA